MDYIGIGGLVLSAAGFALAIWQIRQTRHAAEAASEAAAEAVKSIRNIESVSNVHEICGRSRDLLHLTRARNLASAANAAFELRDSVARFHGTPSRPELPQPNDWEQLLASIGSVHERLESATITNRLSVEERELLIHEIARLHAVFSTLASATASAGATNANT